VLVRTAGEWRPGLDDEWSGGRRGPGPGEARTACEGRLVWAEAANWAEEFGAVYAGVITGPAPFRLAGFSKETQLSRAKGISVGGDSCLSQPAAASPIRLFNRGQVARSMWVSIYSFAYCSSGIANRAAWIEFLQSYSALERRRGIAAPCLVGQCYVYMVEELFLGIWMACRKSVWHFFS
jgi:hypothetical protein